MFVCVCVCVCMYVCVRVCVCVCLCKNDFGVEDDDISYFDEVQPS